MTSRWGIPEVDESTDPFADAVRLQDPAERLVDLIKREARWTEEMGHCEIKDRDWENPTCLTCSYRGSYGELCHIGVEQQRALGQLAIQKARAHE